MFKQGFKTVTLPTGYAYLIDTKHTSLGTLPLDWRSKKDFEDCESSIYSDLHQPSAPSSLRADEAVDEAMVG